MKLQFTSDNVQVVFGPPGTGKTTYLIDRIADLAAQGVSVHNIAFVTFSKAAIQEVRSRLRLTRQDDAPWFRTLHSTAYKLLGLRRDQIFTGLELKRFNQVSGYRLQPPQLFHQERRASAHWSNEALFILQSARAHDMTLEQYLASAQQITRLSMRDILSFERDYNNFKKQFSLYDFGDMIEQCDASFPADVQNVFIDEAQDLTWPQWRFAMQLCLQSDNVTIAGDDDQTIYGFAGATAKVFVDYATEHPHKVTYLTESHRLPRRLLHLSQQVARHLETRMDKPLDTDVVDQGDVRFFTVPTQLPLHQGEWIILARHAYLLEPFAEYIKQCGYSYWLKGTWSTQMPELRAIQAWEHYRATGEPPNSGDKRIIARYYLTRWADHTDAIPPWQEVFKGMPPVYADYWRRLVRNREQGKKRIRLMTFHESKGSEATNVAVLSGYSSAVRKRTQTMRGHLAHQDELRVLYVGLTRARHKLWLQAPLHGANYFQTLLRGVSFQGETRS